MRNPHKKPTAAQRKTWDAKYYQANKTKIQATHKIYRDAHLEEARAQNRKSYYKNHERTLEVRRLRNNKKIFVEQANELKPLFDVDEPPMDAAIKAKFLSMINAEIYVSGIKAKNENNTPEIGLMTLYGEVYSKTWESIALDDKLMSKIKSYILLADTTAYENLTIK